MIEQLEITIEMDAEVTRQVALTLRRTYLSSRHVTQRYAVTRMTLDAWAKSRPDGFPPPLRISGRKRWCLEDLDAWDERLKAAATHELLSRKPRPSKPNPPQIIGYVQPEWAKIKEGTIK